jgi:DNA-binding NtrC family response regulator
MATEDRRGAKDTQSRDTRRVEGDEGLPGAVELVDAFELVILRGPDTGARFRPRGERTVIGTHPSCDVLLKDATVSRFHAEIVSQGGVLRLSDLDSTNGTRVDGVLIYGAALAPRQVITIGDTELRVEADERPVEVAISSRREFGVMVGRSPAMARAFALLERAAASEATVLLDGETGTGKEAAAESIHREGKRKNGPFVVVDCGAIPPDLLESELFGHEKGAFTGASQAREGAFEAASGGTLFLDEIGELAPDLQPKLLRVLEKREVKRVGRTRYVPVDVRIIAATNRSLRAEVNAQRFRSDVYYRLAVIEVRLPALRERREDLPLLVEHFVSALPRERREEAEALSTPEFLAHLGRHSWPGNVRELRNYLERCLALREQPPFVANDDSLEPVVDITKPLKEARESWTVPLERAYLKEILAAHHGNISAVARAAGVERITLYRLLAKYHLR